MMMMTPRTRVLIPAALLTATGLAYADPVLPAEIYLYTDRTGSYDDPSYVEAVPSNWVNGDPGYYYVGRPGRYTPEDETATWTLGVTGDYTVQIHWATSIGGHTNDAQYDLNTPGGTQTFHINQRQRANQQPVPDGLDASYSGWYTLGQAVTLDAGSTIDLTRGAGDAGGFLVANAVRLAAGVDVVIDEQAAATINGPTFATGSAIDRNAQDYTPTTSPISGYKYTQTFDKDAAGGYIEYALGSVTGTSDVWVSWGTHLGHSSNALFVFDQDGDFGTAGDQVTTTRDLRTFANGVLDTPGQNNGIWSGYSYFGQLDLTADSLLRIYNDDGGTSYITGDALRVVNVTAIPEPASFALLALGGGMLLRRKR
jgi:hypothetical protein